MQLITLHVIGALTKKRGRPLCGHTVRFAEQFTITLTTTKLLKLSIVLPLMIIINQAAAQKLLLDKKAAD